MGDNQIKEKQKNIALDKAPDLYDYIVTNAYLKGLKDGTPISLDQQKQPPVRWYKITKIVKEKEVFFADKLSMLYIALHDQAKNVILALKKENFGSIELYLGARDFEGKDCVSGDILESGLRGFLPGVDYEYVPEENFNKTFLAGFNNNDGNDKKEKDGENELAVSSASVLASLRDDKKENFIQGLEKLINASEKFPSFTAYLIAENISEESAHRMIQGFNAMQTWLSPMAESQLTFSASHTDGVSESLTKSFSETVTENISKTVTHSNGLNISGTKSGGEANGVNINVTPIGIGAGGNHSQHSDWSNQIGFNASLAEAIQEGVALSKQRGEQKATSRSRSYTKGTSFQITQKNSQLKRSIELIDKQVERLQNGIPFGLWSVATYFVAPELTGVVELANIYKGCVIGENSSLSVGAINSWDGEKAKIILNYLNKQIHPQFVYEGIEGTVSPGTIVTSEELAIHLSLPQASVPGILVREEQAFGRNVPEELTDENSIDLGTIMYLGKEIKKNKDNEESETNKARIQVETLNKHVFVTGTTGSGKSNTLYCLISKLMERGKKCLVIEPAKGEYKFKFGGIEGVSVYGSDPKQTPLLHINPFEFPKNIDVYQHIDSLVEVFNACWPMYAAMPQVLSHSIIKAYEKCGWDMEHSLNPRKSFPSVKNVLDSLKEYINSSDFSPETKGNYIGSLETRLQSLCDGTVGRMLGGTSIPNDDLFNENVIVDLSQVRSMENQSLIMGLLVLKLDEFRNSEGKGMNQPLRHVTVLEEAHHLLKRTSTTQNAEFSNVAGMAVEKIANSMAEMRTYGEGFIIADQSPSMLDLATIRNTNTKIIMALPEKDDRETAGKSIGLDDKHVEEISRLKTGEAIVYQSGWEEAVKAKIDLFNDESNSRDAMKKACYLLLHCYTSYNAELNRQELLDLLVNAKISDERYNKTKEKLDSMSKKSESMSIIVNPDDIACIFTVIVGTNIFESANRISDETLFNMEVSSALSLKLDITNDDRINGFVNMYMKGCSLMADIPFYEGWLQTTLKNK